MANKLYINGKDVTKDVKNFDEFEIELGLNTATKTISKQLSQTITIKGETYKLIESTFFASCGDYDNTLKGFFKTDICGGIVIDLEITYEGLRNFPEIEEAEITLKSVTEEDKAYAILDSSYWYDNGFVTANNIPIMYYADQPNFISWGIILLSAASRVVFNALDKAINIVCEVATLGIGNCDSNITGAVYSALDTWLTGLGRWATAPLVREILDYQIKHAGLLFASSILNDPFSPYYNMAFFHMDRGFHGSFKDTSKTKRQSVMLENNKLWTVIQLLEKLKVPFEADYRIINGTLYFEKESFFDNLVNDKLFHTKDKCTDPVGYEPNLEENFAVGEFGFSLDSYDTEGNKSIKYYQQKLEFNLPYNPAQKGTLKSTTGFGTPRFMFDQISAVKDGFFDWEKNIDEFRDGPESFIGGFFDNEGIIRKYDLILSGNMLSFPKLIVLEEGFNRNDALAIKKVFTTISGKRFWLFNYPLMYKETLDKIIDATTLQEGKPGALTSEFATLANPRLRKDRLKISSITIKCDCDVVKKALTNFHRVYIDTHYGKGIPTNINIKFSKTKVEISLNDIRVICP